MTRRDEWSRRTLLKRAAQAGITVAVSHAAACSSLSDDGVATTSGPTRSPTLGDERNIIVIFADDTTMPSADQAL